MLRWTFVEEVGLWECSGFVRVGSFRCVQYITLSIT